MKIKVTQDVIDAANFIYDQVKNEGSIGLITPHRCPIALAVVNKGFPDASVGIGSINLVPETKENASVSAALADRIAAWDRDKTMKPFEFIIDRGRTYGVKDL